jgi:predicted nucleic-acid-binding protein
MKTEGEVYAIDANVIIRYLAPETGELADKAEKILDAVADGELTVSCDPVVLGEVVWVLGSFYKLSKVDVAEALLAFLHCDNFIVPEKQRYLWTLQIYGRTLSHFGDCCACAAALDDSNGRLLSFDKRLSGVEGIQRLESV